MFIVIEGPNGAGKTTTAARLGRRLRSAGRAVHVTAEPSDTPLGRLVRSAEAELTGRALALAVAADRHVHVEQEILPALDEGRIVISDRYVPSSLVLQRLDGLDIDEVWEYNARLPAPTLTFYLHLAAQHLQTRLNDRQRLSRLEQAGSPERELHLYRDAHRFLDRRGWRQHWVDCGGKNPDQVTDRILEHLGSLP
ncbi:dTMP kinase [Actinomadura sp. SCN-SB]|uniref:dTMP kinase n=1 Tax=Actinomadura sp. SCN-SB TaxID=3373092 RepID=UPI00375248B7